MAIVNGSNVTLKIYDNGGWRLYACARSCSIRVETTTIETSTTGSGVWAAHEPQKLSWSGSIDGLINLEEPGLLTLADLRAKQIGFEKLLITYERVDADGNVYSDQGTAIITNSEDSGETNNAAPFRIDILGTGALTQVFTPTPLELSAVNRYDGTAAGTEGTTLSIPSLANMDILEFVKDGIGFTVIDSGTPTDKQVKYTVGTGDFETFIPFAAGEPYYILYQTL